MSDLPDKLSTVSQNYNLNLELADINLHQTWNHEGASLATSIHRLEGIVAARVLHDMRNRVCLNDRWLEVVQLCESRLDIGWHFKRLPRGLARL